jgi:hypothetical protein
VAFQKQLLVALYVAVAGDVSLHHQNTAKIKFPEACMIQCKWFES